MASKKQTAEQVKNVLGVGYFESSREVQETDPIEPVSMKIPIDQVAQYDHNPRRVKNPEYDSILESLRANGQDEALTITRRPGSENYMIKRGGNTRLEIMKTLYHETGDERFSTIDCLFKPWTGEADCIVGHLTENTTQGQMTLIDKARGYRQFKLEYEKENDIEGLGQRKLAELLKEKGASVNTPLLGIMNYALDVLEPAIPDTLNRGIGKPQIEKLKRLNQTFERLAEAHGLYDPATRTAQIQAEFHQLLSDHDGDEWDMELILHEFSQRLGELLIDKTSYNRLKYDIDECVKRDPWKIDLISILKNDPEEFQDQEPQTSTDSAKVGNKILAIQTPLPPSTSLPTVSSNQQQVKHDPNSPTPTASTLTTQDKVENLKAQLDAQTTSHTLSRLELPESSYTAGEFDLKSMRARIYTLALQFAKLTHIHGCLASWNAGYGYFLDLPKSKLLSAKDPDKTQPEHEYRVIAKYLNKNRDEVARSLAWWMLWQAQGILDHTGETNLVPGYELMPETNMKEMFAIMYSLDYELEERGSVLMVSGSTKLGMYTGDYLHPIDIALAYTYIKPAHMMKYIELLEARTQLQAYVEEHSINLWKEA